MICLGRFFRLFVSESNQNKLFRHILDGTSRCCHPLSQQQPDIAEPLACVPNGTRRGACSVPRNLDPYQRSPRFRTPVDTSLPHGLDSRNVRAANLLSRCTSSRSRHRSVKRALVKDWIRGQSCANRGTGHPTVYSMATLPRSMSATKIARQRCCFEHCKNARAMSV